MYPGTQIHSEHARTSPSLPLPHRQTPDQTSISGRCLHYVVERWTIRNALLLRNHSVFHTRTGSQQQKKEHFIYVYGQPEFVQVWGVTTRTLSRYLTICAAESRANMVDLFLRKKNRVHLDIFVFQTLAAVPCGAWLLINALIPLASLLPLLLLAAPVHFMLDSHGNAVIAIPPVRRLVAFVTSHTTHHFGCFGGGVGGITGVSFRLSRTLAFFCCCGCAFFGGSLVGFQE